MLEFNSFHLLAVETSYSDKVDDLTEERKKSIEKSFVW